MTALRLVKRERDRHRLCAADFEQRVVVTDGEQHPTEHKKRRMTAFLRSGTFKRELVDRLPKFVLRRVGKTSRHLRLATDWIDSAQWDEVIAALEEMSRRAPLADVI